MLWNITSPCSLSAHHTTFEMKSRDCYYQCMHCVWWERAWEYRTHTEHTHSQVTCKSTESLAVCLYCTVFPSFIPIGLQAPLFFSWLANNNPHNMWPILRCVYTTPLCQPVCLASLHTVNTLHWPEEKRWIEQKKERQNGGKKPITHATPGEIPYYHNDIQQCV